MEHREWDHLQREISRQVNQTLQSVLNSISSATIKPSQEDPSSKKSEEQEPFLSPADKARADYARAKYAKFTKYLNLNSGSSAYQPARQSQTPAYTPVRRPSGKKSSRYKLIKRAGAGAGLGLAMQIVGATATLGQGLALIITNLVFLLDQTFHEMAIANSVLIPLSILSVCMWGIGTSLRKRALRFRRYVETIGSDALYTVERLSAATGIPASTVRQDLPKMLQRGLFPEAYLDEKVTCIMLSEDTYQQYCRLMTQQKQMPVGSGTEKKTLRSGNIQEASASPDAPVEELSPEVRRIIEEGQRYIVQIRDANDALPGEAVSDRLCQLEGITTKIFKYVEQHPEKSPEIRKLMEYHLPTTLKLVDAYRELETQGLGGNASNMKEEILMALDTVNAAFSNLLDNLCQDMMFDVSSDISVLKTMLTQEGLTQGGDFGQNR